MQRKPMKMGKKRIDVKNNGIRNAKQTKLPDNANRRKKVPPRIK